ncbi:MAG: glycosyltransferase [Promethearchaeota archaeon]
MYSENTEDGNELTKAQNKKKLTLITPGFISPFKGIHLVFDAIDGLNDVEYIVAGSVRRELRAHKAYLAKIKKIAPSNVEIIEKFFSMKEFREIIASSDVVILPYLDVSQSGSGILHLSLGLGKPIIASKIGEFVELLKGNALLVDPYDKTALRTAISKMKDQKLKQFYESRTRELASKTSWINVSNEHLKIYQDILKKTYRPMRIAVVSTFGERCGIGEYASFLTNALSQHDLEVLRIKISKDWKFGITVLKTLEKYHPHIVHLQFEYGLFKCFPFFQVGSSILLFYLLSNLFDTKIVTTLHTVYNPHYLWRKKWKNLISRITGTFLRVFIMKIITTMSKRLIVHTKEAKKALLNNNKVIIVRHGTLIEPPKISRAKISRILS